jgi:hypothetical protein
MISLTFVWDSGKYPNWLRVALVKKYE